MLSRAFVPLLRPRGRLVAPRVLASAGVHQTRWYAKNNRNRFPGHRPPQQSQNTQGDFTKPGSTGQYSNLQQEFQSSANASRNTAPNPEDVAQNMKKAGPLSSSSGNTEAGEQDEIEGYANRRPDEENTAPETEPESAAEENIQQHALPDLTQGIPSTIDAELSQARSKQAGSASLNITEDPSESAPPSEGTGGGQDGLPKTAYISSADRKRAWQFRIGYALIFGSTALAIITMGRNWDTAEEERKHTDAPSGWSLGSFYQRFKARLSDTLSWYNEPAFTKLLPDPDPDPLLQAPFTLVVSLEDLLVHSEWSREHGWRLAKRPGVDYFIRYLSQYYELVIWTSQPMMMADPIIRKFDPFRILRWPLFREATLYKNGDHIKDLSYLNRDLSKVLMIDTLPGHAKHQPENAIILPKWTGDPKDTTLVDLIPFLEYLAVMGLDDTRAVLKSFEGKDIPTEFAKREKIMREKFESKQASEKGKKSPVSLGSLSTSLGLKAAGADEHPKMLWDQVRERGQKQYEAFEKEIRENGAKWMAEMAAEEKKATEEAMKNMKGGFANVFGASGGK